MHARMEECMAERHVQATIPEARYQSLWQVAKRRNASLKATARRAYVRQATPAEDDPLFEFVGSGTLEEGNWARRKDWQE
jgi:hypothetical protein